MIGLATDSRRTLSSGWAACRFAWRAAPRWLNAQVIVTVLSGAAPVVSVWLLKVALDALVAGRAAELWASAAGLVAVGLVAAVVPVLSRFLQDEIGRQIGRAAQDALFSATERLTGLARVEDPAFRDRLRLAQQGGRGGPGQVVDGLAGMTQAVITLVGLVVVLVGINPLMAGIALLGLAPALAAEVHLSRVRTRMLWRVSPIERREFFYADLLTSLPAAKELRLLGLAGLFRRRMLGELAEADGQRRRVDGREARYQLLLGVFSAVLLGAGLVWAVTAAMGGLITVGGVSAFVASLTGFQGGLVTLVSRMSGVYQSLLLFNHFQHVLESEPDLPAPPVPLAVPPLRRGIRLHDVWFRYGPDEPWVLRGVTLVIPHGEAVALVGANGAGKSTLVKLLCRFYDPERGSISWDGVDLREMDMTGLRQRIGALFQDFMHYDLSASENIGLGDVSAMDDLARIRAAAERAGVHDTIEALPRGYDTMLSRIFFDAPPGEDPKNGVLLSGGQWQRLALARALLRDQRDLLILDEPSSGLDARTEHELHRALRAHRAGATSLLISHRLGALRDADRIIVLLEGQVQEQGTHSQLMAADGEYATMFRLQAEGYRDEAVELQGRT